MNITGNFTFYPVGQGCFYVGDLRLKGQKFVFVYDCGTDTGGTFLQDSISDFKRKHQKIDLLIISHFHEDHVSGVQDLLAGIRCDRILIPYYTPIERLLLASSNPNATPNYLAFLADPISFLTNIADVGEVILVGGNDETDGEQPSSDKPLPVFDKVFRLEIINQNPQEDENFKNAVLELEGPHRFSNKLYLSQSPKLSLSGVWEFVFYVKKFDSAAVTAFRNAVDNLLSPLPGGGELRDLFSPTNIKKTHGLYSTHIIGNINYTSLCLYHRPVDRCRSIYLNGLLVLRYSGFMRNNLSGTLLTGDSFLRQSADFNNFCLHFGASRIAETYFFQLPHHGSAGNWNILPNTLKDIPFFVVNHGFKRRHHPSNTVIENINRSSTYKNVLYNHQFSRIDYRIIAVA
ncbi:MAG TPA: MBL fold metallo-hydrolase [Flavobacterium sp.]|nr:MBL fold metallo-hydrolase [Flavobacterium sp.]